MDTIFFQILTMNRLLVKNTLFVLESLNINKKFEMEKLLGTLAFSKVPKVERSRKREQKEGKEKEHEKRPKLLEDVLNGEKPYKYKV